MKDKEIDRYLMRPFYIVIALAWVALVAVAFSMLIVALAQALFYVWAR